jgi:hypothetical protein
MGTWRGWGAPLNRCFDLSDCRQQNKISNTISYSIYGSYAGQTICTPFSKALLCPCNRIQPKKRLSQHIFSPLSTPQRLSCATMDVLGWKIRKSELRWPNLTFCPQLSQPKGEKKIAVSPGYRTRIQMQ